MTLLITNYVDENAEQGQIFSPDSSWCSIDNVIFLLQKLFWMKDFTFCDFLRNNSRHFFPCFPLDGLSWKHRNCSTAQNRLWKNDNCVLRVGWTGWISPTWGSADPSPSPPCPAAGSGTSDAISARESPTPRSSITRWVQFNVLYKMFCSQRVYIYICNICIFIWHKYMIFCMLSAINICR